jgi:branched-chain amino acid transport system substrate-binding protein
VGEVGIDFIKGDLARNLGLEPDKLRLAMVYEDSIFGSTAAKAIDQYAKAAGVTVVDSISYNRSSVVLRAKSARPDVLFLASYIPDGTPNRAAIPRRSCPSASFGRFQDKTARIWPRR